MGPLESIALATAVVMTITQKVVTLTQVLAIANQAGMYAHVLALAQC